MKSFSTELKVGLFVVAGFFLLGYIFFILSPKIGGLNYNSYYTHLDNAAGIIAKSQIRTNGVLIGEVSKVELDSRSTRIGLLIDSELKLPEGTTIELRSRGLLGDVYLEVVRAPDDGSYIANNSLLPNAENSMSMNSLVKMFGSIGGDIKSITSALAESTTKDGKSTLRSILQNLEKSTNSLNDILSDNKQNIKSVLQNLNSNLVAIKEGLYDEEGNRFARIADSVDKSFRNLEKSSDSIFAVTKKIERGEGTIGKLLNDETTIDKIEGALGDVRNFLSPIANLSVAVDWRGESGTTSSENIRNYLNLKLKTRPDKYYMVGFADVGVKDSLTQTTRTTTSADGPTTIESVNQQSKEEKAIKFNAQFAKRWGSFGFRVGLFESTGGFATDVFAFKDKFQWSVEAFDFDRDDKDIRKAGHFKTYASYTFFNHIYAVAGIDDISQLDVDGKIEKDLDYFLGAGLKFTDNDIKALVGTVAGAAR